MTAIAILDEALSLAGLAMRSIEAAQNGDQETANKFLAEARQRYKAASDKWDATPFPDAT